MGHFGHLQSTRDLIYWIWQASFKTGQAPILNRPFLSHSPLTWIISVWSVCQSLEREGGKNKNIWACGKEVKTIPKVILCSCMLVKKKYQVGSALNFTRLCGTELSNMSNCSLLYKQGVAQKIWLIQFIMPTGQTDIQLKERSSSNIIRWCCLLVCVCCFLLNFIFYFLILCCNLTLLVSITGQK